MTTSISSSQGIPPFLRDYLCRELGSDYSTSYESIGCNCSVQIFRPRPLTQAGEELRLASLPEKGIVFKVPRNQYAVQTLARESKNLQVLSPLFPISPAGRLSVSCSDSNSSTSLTSIEIPKVLSCDNFESSPSSPQGLSTVHISSLLPGVNAAAAFLDYSMPARFELVRSIARALRVLQATQVPENVIGKLHCRGSSRSLIENSRTVAAEEQFPAASSTHSWFRQVVFDFLGPEIEKKASRSVPQQKDTDEVVRQNVAVDEDQQAALERLELLKSYANYPNNDPFWTADTKGRLVLVHGDFMLPNILVSMDSITETSDSRITMDDKSSPKVNVSGIVDWGDCGLGDGRYDLWACVWSIEFNAGRCKLSGSQGQKLAHAFLDEYHDRSPAETRLESRWENVEKDLEVWEALNEAFYYVSRTEPT